MLYTCRIRLETPLLGDIRDRNTPASRPVFRMLRDARSGNPRLREETWAWAWDNVLPRSCYRHAVRMGCNLGAVKVFDTAPLYEFRKNTSQGTRITLHESVRKGTVLTLAFRVVDSPDPDDIAAGIILPDQTLFMPSDSEVRDGLVEIGSTFGISPFGKIEGYGRFTLIELEKHDSAALVEREQPGGIPGAPEDVQDAGPPDTVFTEG